MNSKPFDHAYFQYDYLAVGVGRWTPAMWMSKESLFASDQIWGEDAQPLWETNGKPTSNSGEITTNFSTEGEEGFLWIGGKINTDLNDTSLSVTMHPKTLRLYK